MYLPEFVKVNAKSIVPSTNMVSIIGPNADTIQLTAETLPLITMVDTSDHQVATMVEIVTLVAATVVHLLIPILLQMVSLRIISNRLANVPGSKIVSVCKYSPFSKLCVLVVLIYK